MKISVFMPITNAIWRGDTFIEAMLTHLYWADELVVVDGGSVDGSIEKIQALKDKRIKIITRDWPQENWSWAEFSKSFNAGLDACSGDWVAAGESDHIFHEDEAGRVREEIERETAKGKAVMRCQKMQSGSFDKWQSKAQMYYFVYKKKFPQIRYGFDARRESDLVHPIWHDGETFFEEGVPQGTLIKERTQYEGLIGGTGANIYNYLWTFKTFDMVLAERIKAMAAWNNFAGFTNVYRKAMPTDPKIIKEKLIGQILNVRERAKREIPFHLHPWIMQEKIKKELTPEMIGHPDWGYHE